MNFELKRTATLSLLALTLGAALAGCATAAPAPGPSATDAVASASSSPSTSTESADSASTAPVDAGSDEKSAAGAKKATDAFLFQINKDMGAFITATMATTDSGKQLSDAEFYALLKESSTGTAAYLKTGSFDDKQIKNLFTQFGSVYYESKGVGEVEIATDESDFVLTGDTAVIKGESFKASIDGAPVAVSEVNSGDLTLEYVDGTWLVSEQTPAA